MCVNTGCNNCTENCGCSCSNCCNNNCNSCTADPCNEQPCGCPFEVDFSCVRYTGVELECLNIQNGETLEQFLVRLNSVFCDLSSAEDGVDGDSAYQVWLNLGNVGTEQDFIDSLAGQGVDHVRFTSSTGGGVAGVAGETDTYTVWGDVGETINLGTFIVYNGVDGVDGTVPSGIITFDHYDRGTLDYVWTNSVDTITGVTRTVASDGMYQVHANIQTTFNITDANTANTIGIYVNGIAVVLKTPVAPTHTAGVFTRDIPLLWRGSLTNGDVVDVRVTSASGNIVATSTYSELLINKEN